MKLSLNHAEQHFPAAWAAIQRQIAEVKSVTDADFVPVSAAIFTEGGEELLEIVTVTDLVGVGSGHDATAMHFRAPLAPPPPAPPASEAVH